MTLVQGRSSVTLSEWRVKAFMDGCLLGWKPLIELGSSSPSWHWPHNASQAVQKTALSNGLVWSRHLWSSNSIFLITGSLGAHLDEGGARLVTPLMTRRRWGPPFQGLLWAECQAFKPARWFFTVLPTAFCAKEATKVHKEGSSTGHLRLCGTHSFSQKIMNKLMDLA